MSHYPELTAAVATAIDTIGMTADIAFPDVIRRVRQSHPDACVAYADAAVDKLITSIAKRILKPDDAERLPGFEGMPLRLPIATEGGYIWRPARYCTRDDLNAYLDLLNDQIEADIKRRDDYRRAMREVLRLLDAHGVDRLVDVA